MANPFRPALTAIVMLAVTALLAAPTARAIELPEIDFEFYQLENGLEVILYEDHSTPMVGVNIWYHVGSGNERPGRSGFAHLFEHMMFQGSEHQDGEYLSTIQSLGGDVNGSTSEDRTNYWEIVTPSRLEAVLLLEADRMGWLLPAMTQEKFENQQDVVRNERRQWEGQPYASFWLNLNEQFYPKGHPYDHSVIGIHEDLENASLEDVKDFFRTYYTPTNATLSISGDFDPAETKEWVKKYFGPIPPGPPVQSVKAWIPAISGEKRVVLQDRVQLPRLYFCWHTPPMYGEGEADVDFATSIVGGGESSRLYKRLVHEEGLAQSVSFDNSGQQVVSLAVLDITLKPGVSQAKVERIVEEELARFAAEGPTKRELERVRNNFEAGFVKGVQRIGSWGGINDRLNRYNHYVGTPDYFRQDYERYASRTAETVRAEFSRWIGPDRMLLLIEPYDEDARAIEVADVDRTKLPTPGDMQPFSTPELSRGRLENGLKLVVAEHHELPLVRLELVFGSGTSADPADRAGLCDVSAGMLLEGTKKRDKFEFQDELEFLGTDIWYWTGRDQTTLSMQALKSHLDESLALAAEALLQPAFPEKEFQVDKERRIVNIRRESDSPRTVAAKVTRRLMYGDDHPYGRAADGTVESMEAIALDEAREFARRHFVPGNATLIAVGDITQEELERSVKRALGDWKGEAPPPVTVPKPEPRAGRGVYLVDKPGDTQSTITVAQFGIPRNHPDWESIYLVNRMLGGFFSSRLNLNLREDKGYTYGSRSYTAERKGTSLYTLGARVQTEVTAPALVEFMKEYEGGAGAEPFTEEELAFSKDNILLGYSQDFETIGQLAGAMRDQVTFGLADDDYARYPEKIAAVTVQEANSVAKDYLDPESAAVIVVGDVGKIEDEVRKLNLGPIRYCDREGNLLDTNSDYSSQ